MIELALKGKGVLSLVWIKDRGLEAYLPESWTTDPEGNPFN